MINIYKLEILWKSLTIYFVQALYVSVLLFSTFHILDINYYYTDWSLLTILYPEVYGKMGLSIESSI